MPWPLFGRVLSVRVTNIQKQDRSGQVGVTGLRSAALIAGYYDHSALTSINAHRDELESRGPLRRRFGRRPMAAAGVTASSAAATATPHPVCGETSFGPP